MNVIETEHGNFEIIKDEQSAFNIADFDKKFVELFIKYEYIVGDYFQTNLRLKGFNKENAHRIPDYINEFCALDSNYYILKNLSYDPNYVISED